MESTTLDRIPLQVEETDVSFYHLACGRNDDLAICGTDITGCEYIPRDINSQSCVVCDEIACSSKYCPSTKKEDCNCDEF